MKTFEELKVGDLYTYNASGYWNQVFKKTGKTSYEIVKAINGTEHLLGKKESYTNVDSKVYKYTEKEIGMEIDWDDLENEEYFSFLPYPKNKEVYEKLNEVEYVMVKNKQGEVDEKIQSWEGTLTIFSYPNDDEEEEEEEGESKLGWEQITLGELGVGDIFALAKYRKDTFVVIDGGHFQVLTDEKGKPDPNGRILTIGEDMSLTSTVYSKPKNKPSIADIEKMVSHIPEIAKELLDIAREWGKKYYGDISGLSVRAAELYTYLQTRGKRLVGIEQVEVLTDISSILLGETIPKRKVVNVEFVRGLIIVPIDNSNGHDYPMNEPCLHHRGLQFLKMTGELGNNMDHRNDCMRPATLEEIQLFLESAIKSNPSALVQILNSLDKEVENEQASS